MCTAILAQRILTSTERWLIVPLFAVLGIVLILIGAKAIRSKRIRAKASAQVLYGKKEWTGGMAVFQGIAFCGLGTAMIVIAALTMILGRALA